MGQVTITLNGRSYRLRCGEGEEARLIALAEHVETKLGGLVAEFGQVGDDRLLVMAALLITDELFEARDALVRQQTADVDVDVAAFAAMQPMADDAAALASADADTPIAAGEIEARQPLPPAAEPDRPGEPPIKRAMRRNEARASLTERIAEARDAPLVRGGGRG